MSAYAISSFRSVICFIEKSFSVYQKGGLVYVYYRTYLRATNADLFFTKL